MFRILKDEEFSIEIEYTVSEIEYTVSEIEYTVV